MKVFVKCDMCDTKGTFVIKHFDSFDMSKGHNHIYPSLGILTSVSNNYAEYKCPNCSSPISFELAISTKQNGIKAIERMKANKANKKPLKAKNEKRFSKK